MSHGPFPRFLSTPTSDSRQLRVASRPANSLQARRRSSRSTILHPCGPLPNKLSRFSPKYSFSRVLSDSLIRVIRVNSWARLSCPRITRMTRICVETKSSLLLRAFPRLNGQYPRNAVRGLRKRALYQSEIRDHFTILSTRSL